MTEETNSTSNVVPVGDIRFNFDEKSYAFSPTEDISAKEVCLVLQMVLNVLANRNAKIDLGSFINQHNLGRHFTEIPETEEESK